MYNNACIGCIPVLVGYIALYPLLNPPNIKFRFAHYPTRLQEIDSIGKSNENLNRFTPEFP